MHARSLKTSKQLQKFYTFLLHRGPATTREIIQGTGICNVSTAASELRHSKNGIPVDCKQIAHGIFQYSLGEVK